MNDIVLKLKVDIAQAEQAVKTLQAQIKAIKTGAGDVLQAGSRPVTLFDGFAQPILKT